MANGHQQATAQQMPTKLTAITAYGHGQTVCRAEQPPTYLPHFRDEECRERDNGEQDHSTRPDVPEEERHPRKPYRLTLTRRVRPPLHNSGAEPSELSVVVCIITLVSKQTGVTSSQAREGGTGDDGHNTIDEHGEFSHSSSSVFVWVCLELICHHLTNVRCAEGPHESYDVTYRDSTTYA